MAIDALGIYESKIYNMKVVLIRCAKDMGRAKLYINGKFKGIAPYYYTISRMMELEDKNYPIYKWKELK